MVRRYSLCQFEILASASKTERNPDRRSKRERRDRRSTEFYKRRVRRVQGEKKGRRERERERGLYHRQRQLKIIIGRIRAKDGEAGGGGNSADRLKAAGPEGKPVAAD